jgi:hypothetical protein
MQKNTILIIVGVVGGFLVLCAGCSGITIFAVARVLQSGAENTLKKEKENKDRRERLDYLKEVGMALHIHNDARQRPPANLEEMLPYVTDPRVKERLKSGEIEVVWGAKRIMDQPGGSSNVIYAWDTKAAADGKRLVLFMDMSTRELSESEFQNKPKAAK